MPRALWPPCLLSPHSGPMLTCTWPKQAATAAPLNIYRPAWTLFLSNPGLMAFPVLILHRTSHWQTSLCSLMSTQSLLRNRYPNNMEFCFVFVVLGMEPRTLFTLGRYSTIKLCPQPFAEICWVGALLLDTSPSSKGRNSTEL